MSDPFCWVDSDVFGVKISKLEVYALIVALDLKVFLRHLNFIAVLIAFEVSTIL